MEEEEGKLEEEAKLKEEAERKAKEEAERKKKEERKDVLEAKVAEGVVRYIEMKEGGHFQYGMSFIASQVISRF